MQDQRRFPFYGHFIFIFQSHIVGKFSRNISEMKVIVYRDIIVIVGQILYSPTTGGRRLGLSPLVDHDRIVSNGNIWKHGLYVSECILTSKRLSFSDYL